MPLAAGASRIVVIIDTYVVVLVLVRSSQRRLFHLLRDPQHPRMQYIDHVNIHMTLFSSLL